MIGRFYRYLDRRVRDDPAFAVFFIYAFGCSLAAVAVAVILLLNHFWWSV
jgi:hypothetical protein